MTVNINHFLKNPFNNMNERFKHTGLEYISFSSGIYKCLLYWHLKLDVQVCLVSHNRCLPKKIHRTYWKRTHIFYVLGKLPVNVYLIDSPSFGNIRTVLICKWLILVDMFHELMFIYKALFKVCLSKYKTEIWYKCFRFWNFHRL